MGHSQGTAGGAGEVTDELDLAIINRLCRGRLPPLPDNNSGHVGRRYEGRGVLPWLAAARELGPLDGEVGRWRAAGKIALEHGTKPGFSFRFSGARASLLWVCDAFFESAFRSTARCLKWRIK